MQLLGCAVALLFSTIVQEVVVEHKHVDIFTGEYIANYTGTHRSHRIQSPGTHKQAQHYSYSYVCT